MVFELLIHTMNHYSTLKKERAPAVCDNISEPGGHYGKGNSPGTEG